LFEVRGVFRGQERALMMVKPPRDFRRAGILEVHDGVFVAIEFRFVEKRTGAMQQAAENKVGVFADSFLIKTREEGSRARPIKTFVVVKNFDSQLVFFPNPNSTAGDCLAYRKFFLSGKGKSKDAVSGDTHARHPGRGLQPKWRDLVVPTELRPGVDRNPWCRARLYVRFACFSAMSPITGSLNICPW